MPMPKTKWSNITMDFLTSLPLTKNNRDTIWVIVDRLTKSAHFLAIKLTDPLLKLAQLYIKEVVRLHGIPNSIVSDRDPRFVSKFWRAFHKAMGTDIHLSTAYHPQTDGQSERTIQSLEDLLKSCILEFSGNWDVHLPLVEFSYNNSYHSTIKMAPFEALYGRKCATPLCWLDPDDRELLVHDLID
ncbi:hypothetical protein, partial [Escherichia coli]|uniref:hypothetical protein n=1 Tax=Escherichia coli TaxID=562 RepID=UPI003F4758C0